ncbi:LOW QUALITY PROTEIN: whirlin-like [Portunus trituberculatus]|uniref:LOW QUALITY PROTEIN: whirlin-like n=1 Tax=Portunus trituberculatus TaxID=210409 RepID=UPI001E1D0299|nr:LOW QUALITY PROTEIN: whirlin-like [Portunus trituberculatus]
MPQDFNKLPRGPRGVSPHPDVTDEDEERLAALVSSVEAALRRIHSGLQESYIMYENPDDEEDPPPPQPVTASLRDPPPSPVPPHEISGSPPPPASPPEPLAAGPPPGGIGVGAPRLVGPDNASRLSRELGFIPIQEGAPQPPPPPPRPAEHHKAHHHRHHLHHQHKLSKKVKNHKSKVLLSGLMSCPGPGFRLLHLRRDPASGQGFGFSIKGGREAGIGVYVSRVEQGGPAWRAGLRPGDLLLAADNTNFSSVTHTEAIAAILLLKSAEEVTLTVATTSQLPAPVVVAQTYSWVTADGRATSPPPEYNPRLHHHQVSTVEVEVVGSESLGLMIRGGVEYSLGIFITGVDQDSAAYKAGLKVGDQILEVNSESFLAVTHDTAVNILKYSRRLQLCVRRVGRIPHSCTTYDRRSWPPSAKKDNGRSAENMEATLAMIEEKSERVLTRTAHARLREVVSDYAAGRVPIHHLLTTANELLTSPDKLSLLTELREAVRPEDQVIFDAAVFRGAARPREKQQPRRHSHTGDSAALGKALVKPSGAHHHAHGQRTAHARKQYDDFERPSGSRGREDYDGLASSPSRLRDEYSRSSPRGREEYDPPGRMRDDYDSSPSRVRHDYDHSSQSRGRSDYDQARNNYEEYERSRGRDEYERHSPAPRVMDYSPSRGLKDDYPSLDDYEDSQDPRRRRDEVREDEADEDVGIDFELQESSTNPTAPSSVRVLDDYGDNRLRNDYDYDHSRHMDDYPMRDEYPHHSHHHRALQRDHSDADDYREVEGDYEGYGRHYREVIEPASPTPRNSHHYHQHHHRHQHHLTTDARQVCGDGGSGGGGSGGSGGGSPSSPGGGKVNSAPPTVDDSREETHTPFACTRGRRTSLVVSDSQGRFRVVVKKTRPNLGIAIEGGADTKQKLPRVINIAANGAAFEAGGLRVGQLILAVDGQKLDGHSHEEAARLIAGCWVSRSRPEVEFMVVERKQTAADVRRSSISLLSQM